MIFCEIGKIVLSFEKFFWWWWWGRVGGWGLLIDI
jgi:hypothetical protein